LGSVPLPLPLPKPLRTVSQKPRLVDEFAFSTEELLGLPEDPAAEVSAAGLLGLRGSFEGPAPEGVAEDPAPDAPAEDPAKGLSILPR